MERKTDNRLKSIVERIERLEEDRKGLGADIREIFAEAKGSGYDPKIIRLVLKKRKMSDADRAEQEALLDTYEAALGSQGRFDFSQPTDDDDQRVTP